MYAHEHVPSKLTPILIKIQLHILSQCVVYTYSLSVSDEPGRSPCFGIAVNCVKLENDTNTLRRVHRTIRIRYFIINIYIYVYVRRLAAPPLGSGILNVFSIIPFANCFIGHAG